LVSISDLKARKSKMHSNRSFT